MTHDPKQLFELFYKNITLDMNPPGFPKHYSLYMRDWWWERFINAYRGIQEPWAYQSWAEAPKMWLAGYYEKN